MDGAGLVAQLLHLWKTIDWIYWTEGQACKVDRYLNPIRSFGNFEGLPPKILLRKGVENIVVITFFSAPGKGKVARMGTSF